MKRRVILASSSALLLTRCASAPVYNWQIAAIAGPVQKGSGAKISVRSIGLPGALNQPGVPKPGPDNAANSFPNDLWAAPLASMLQTSMVENLVQRLPQDVILADGGAIGATPDQYVEIQILDFSPNNTGLVTLRTQLATRPFGAQNWTLKSFNASAEGGQTAESITLCMSQLWGLLADHLAAILA